MHIKKYDAFYINDFSGLEKHTYKAQVNFLQEKLGLNIADFNSKRKKKTPEFFIGNYLHKSYTLISGSEKITRYDRIRLIMHAGSLGIPIYLLKRNGRVYDFHMVVLNYDPSQDLTLISKGTTKFQKRISYKRLNAMSNLHLN